MEFWHQGDTSDENLPEFMRQSWRIKHADWEKFKETVVEIVPLYLECRRKTAESVGLGEKLAEN